MSEAQGSNVLGMVAGMRHQSAVVGLDIGIESDGHPGISLCCHDGDGLLGRK